MGLSIRSTLHAGLYLALSLSLYTGCDDEPAEVKGGEMGGAIAGESGGHIGGHMGGHMGGHTGGQTGGHTGGHMGGETPSPNVPLSGEYFMNLYLAEFSLFMPFKLNFEPGVDQFNSVSISAVKPGEEEGSWVVSDPMKVLEAVSFVEGEPLEIDFGEATLPGAFSPTATPVEINLKLSVEELRESSFCGLVTGEVVTFMTEITLSTFAAYPWGEQGDEPAAGCTEEEVSYDPIESCPELVEGLNEAFPSAGIERSFRVVLPEGYDASMSYPLLFAFHGLGGSISGFLEQSVLDVAAQDGGVILIVPESQGLGAEWQSGFYGPTKDLAFFDDMLTCAQESFSVDPAQVHVAGHSAGSFFSAALSLQRDAVLASTSLISAGMSVDYRAPESKRPFFFLWGGVEDSAFRQDFHVQTTALIETFSSEGHPVLYCDHSPLELMGDDSRHSWPDLISEWVVDFIKAHPQGVSPLPYAEGTPEAWTGDCGVR